MRSMCTNFAGGAARAGLALVVLLAVAVRAAYAADLKALADARAGSAH